MRKCTVLMALAAAIGAAPLPAQAEEFYIAADWPIRLVDRPLVLGASMLELRGDTLRLNLSDDAVGDPISLAPDLYYGLDQRVTLGYFHDTGICISGDGCSGTYNDLGVEALYSLIYDGAITMAGRIGATMGPLEVFTAGVHVGLPVRVRGGDLAVLFDPRLYVGVFNRDLRKEHLDLPVQLQYQLTEQNALLLSTGMRGPLSGFGDDFEVPVGVGALFAIARRVDVGGELVFPNLAGRGGGVDQRLLIVRMAVRI